MIWSMGNEVWGYEKHLDLQKKLYDVFKALDPVRPVTQGWSTHTYIDIAGFNANGEGKNDLSNFHKEQPHMAAIGTEIPHTRQTRGVYRTMTSYNPWDQPDKSGHEASAANKQNLFHIPDLSEEEVFTDVDLRYASGYDNQTRKISVRDAWKQVRGYDFYMGDFRWTGFDYLGEAWGWPARTNNYGVIDLAGFPKDNFYLYQSLWTDKPMVHVLPHWTHLGKEGVEIPVVVYTNGDAAELFLNGESLGKKKINEDTLQIVWQVPYQKGDLLAVAYRDGKEIARDNRITAGKAAEIQLSVDKNELRANRRDVVHVEVDITDASGNFVPIANDAIHFEVTGPYKLLGVENGDILDMGPHKVLERKAFMGKALLILQATDNPGTIGIKASAKDLKPQDISIIVNK
jgi:beta-galactosidase